MANDEIARRVTAGLADAGLMAAAHALRQGRLGNAEHMLKTRLRADPFDVLAIRMLAELAAQLGRVKDCEALLRRALALAPGFSAARVNLATVLYQTNRAGEALELLAALPFGDDDDNPNLRAAVLNRLGEFEEALRLYEATLERGGQGGPGEARTWLSYGHVLKTVGRLADGVTAYRRAISLVPGFGEAWWSLANLKTVRFSRQDIDAMSAVLPQVDGEDRFHLEFALGKAFEDEGDAEQAFTFYAQANAHRRALIDYDAAKPRLRAGRMRALFDPAFFAVREGWGCRDAAPIFVVGMPRSGSTLIEQILASHSEVEAITELPDIPELWGTLGEDPFTALATLDAEGVRALGAQYLARVLPQRQTTRPRFIDKLPNNWMFAGFIRLILPRATIIDARRHPLSCGWANFRQHFARGQHFSYDLADTGHYYADCVATMDHFREVLPASVHRVVYEDMVADAEQTIRALLAACNLEFEPGCLAFHETERPVRTPSSEQVRSPIFTRGTENWQPFDAMLGPLREALGPTLAHYRD